MERRVTIPAGVDSDVRVRLAGGAWIDAGASGGGWLAMLRDYGTLPLAEAGRFAGQIRGGPKDTVFKFDDVGCLVFWLRDKADGIEKSVGAPVALFSLEMSADQLAKLLGAG